VTNEQHDAETIDATPALEGGPADPPARRTTFADLVTRADERRPIVPASLRSRAGRHALAVWAVAAATHGVVYHLSRSPKYAAKAAWWALPGLLAALWRPLRWASAEEGNWHLRQHAANSADADTWLKLDARRMRQARWRMPLVLVVFLAVAVGLAVGHSRAPGWAQAAVVVAAVIVFARMGRPADRPILDRVFAGSRFIRLTAELTRGALVASGAGIKDPGAVKFNRESTATGPATQPR
jgi:S-DNA-T family DNA segregation ATPase FtsK/SpoIIIE